MSDFINYREKFGDGPGYMAFKALESLPKGTFRRICEERADIIELMMKNLMLIKLQYGELPFTIDPSDYYSCRVIAEKLDMELFEVVEHCEFLQHTGIIRYYSKTELKRTFFNFEGEVNPFPTFAPAVNRILLDKPKDQVREIALDLFLNKQVLRGDLWYSSPGVSTSEYD